MHLLKMKFIYINNDVIDSYVAKLFETTLYALRGVL